MSPKEAKQTSFSKLVKRSAEPPPVRSFICRSGNSAISVKECAEQCVAPVLQLKPNTPGRIRTCDTRFRKAVLYPLSYGGA